ncbi:hypothetical protein DES46_10415 [Caldimonas thermodepolymerans]|uniref:Uncharacterized protein n=1 Tax=Caldimonas thermodepolymerans TaxID=215580 RepID=A0AA46HVU4_9BURK|nr:hypothetical protein DES46_10415 [Caldimonas thermodepolymerans]TCP07266.1 hypothetical protein EV676_105292 [Caldimonas thermodepolymerans]
MQKPPFPADRGSRERDVAPEWAPTRPLEGPATAIMHGEADGTGSHDIGRPVGDNVWELFVSCDAAEALRLQFSHRASRHIALHDLGDIHSRQLLRQFGAWGCSPVQRLVIRQQGYGTTLASIEYVSFLAEGGETVRIYSTAVDSTPAAQQAVARVLLEMSQASIVLLGEMGGQHCANALRSTLQYVHAAGWTCPNLLVLPFGAQAAAAAAAQCNQVVQRPGLLLRAAPTPARPADAWNYILGFWQKNHMRGRLAAPARAERNELPPLTLDLPPAPGSGTLPVSAPMPLPAATALSTAPAPGTGLSAALSTYLRLVSGLAGLQACCIFDIDQGTALAHAGSTPSATQLAQQGAALFRAQHLARLAMSLAEPTQEMLLSSERHHQVVRPLPGDRRLALHCVFERSKTNQSLIRFQLQKLDAWLKRQPA